MASSEDNSASKLDNLGKDDLVKLIKKYIVAQKQLKSRNEELTNKLNNYENTNNKSVNNHYQHVNGDCGDNNVDLINDLKSKIESLEKVNKKQLDTIDDLTVKLNSLNSDFELKSSNVASEFNSRIEKLKNDLQVIENSNKQYVNQLEEKNQLIQELKVIIDSEKKSSTSVIDDLNAKVAGLNEEKCRLVELNNSNEVRIDEICKKNEKELKTNDELVEKLKCFEKDLSELNEKNRQLEEEKLNLVRANDEMKKKCEEYAAKNDELSEINRKLDQECKQQDEVEQQKDEDNSGKQIEELNEKLNTLKDDFDKLNERYEMLIDENKKVLDDYNKVKDEMDKNKNEFNEINKRLLDEIEIIKKASVEQQTERMDSNEKLNRLEDDIRQLNTRNSCLLDENSSLVNEIDELKKSNQELSETNEKLNKEIEEIKQNLNNSRNEMTCVSELNSKVSQLEDDNKKLQEIVNDFEKVKSSLETNYDLNEQKIDDLNREISELRERKEYFENENNKLTQTIDELNDEIEKIKDIEAENKRVIDELNKTIEEYKTNYEKLDGERTNLIENNDELQKQIDLMQEGYEQYKEDQKTNNEKYEREIELNKSMLEMLNNEIKMLTNEKTQLEKRLLQLKRNSAPPAIIEEDEEMENHHSTDDKFVDNNEFNNKNGNNHTFNISSSNIIDEADNENSYNKQIEDLTFYNDELKSDLEVEREKNAEYQHEILSYKKQIEDFEEQHNSEIKELNARHAHLMDEFNKFKKEANCYLKSIIQSIQTCQTVNNEVSDDLSMENLKEEIEKRLKLLNSTNVDTNSQSTKKGNDESVKQRECVFFDLVYKLNVHVEKHKDSFIVLNDFDNLFVDQSQQILATDDEIVRSLFDLKQNLKEMLQFIYENYRKSEIESLNKLENEMKERIKSRESQIENLIKEFKVQIDELNGQIKSATDEKTQLSAKLNSLHAEYNQQKDLFAKTQATLEKLEKESQKSHLMDLEMADYGRSLNSLNAQLTQKDKQIGELKQEIETANSKITKYETDMQKLSNDKTQIEEKLQKVKQLAAKAKKELSEAKATETERSSVETSLKAQIESLQMEIDNYKIQLVDLTSEKQKLQEKVFHTNDSHLKEVKENEKKTEKLKVELSELNENYKQLETEFNNYKVRVQHAFKKQKELSSEAVATSTSATQNQEAIQIENKQLKQTVEQLNEKIINLTNKMTILEKELELAQDEYQRALDRYTKLLGETKKKESEWKHKNDDLVKEFAQKSNEYAEIIKKLKDESESTNESYKKQLKEIKIEQSQAIELLQTELDSKKDEIKQLLKEKEQMATQQMQQQQQQQQQTYAKSRSNDDYPISETKVAKFQLMHNDSFSSNKSENLSRTQSMKQQNLINTFEELLDDTKTERSDNYDNNRDANNDDEDEDDEDNEQSGTNRSLYNETTYKQLKDEFNKTKMKLQHLSELLNETELNNERLCEQVNVLKEEIRRLERNQEREKSIANMEYLKNIVFKYLTFNNSQEKLQLLPVLTTILKLSQDEHNTILQSISGTSNNNNNSSSTSANNSSNWTYWTKWK